MSNINFIKGHINSFILKTPKNLLLLIALAVPFESGIASVANKNKLSSSIAAKVATEVTEYKAQYHVSLFGVRTATLTQRLAKVGAKKYIAENHLVPNFNVIPFKQFELTAFMMVNNNVKPMVHEYMYKDHKIKKSGFLRYNWKHNIASNSKTYYKIDDYTFDPMSYVIQLKNDIRKGKNYFTYKVLKDHSYINYAFSITGREQIQTPYGVLDTLRVQHTSPDGVNTISLWFAVDHDYMLARMIKSKHGYMYSKTEIFALDQKIKS